MSLANAVRQAASGHDANVAKVLLDLKAENTQMRAQLARLESADAAGAKRARLLASPAPSDASAADLEATCRTKGFCFRFNKGSCPEVKCRYKHTEITADERKIRMEQDRKIALCLQGAERQEEKLVSNTTRAMVHAATRLQAGRHSTLYGVFLLKSLRSKCGTLVQCVSRGRRRFELHFESCV